jgi:hypothetical protein
MRGASRRLFRRFLWFLIYQWKSLTLKQWPYESCRKCGKSFRLLWYVEDIYWKRVMDVNDSGGGSYCVDCFIERANNLGIIIPDEAIEIKPFQPKGKS